MAVLALVSWAISLGWGEYAALIIYAGLVLAALTATGLWAERKFAEPIGPRLRDFCFQLGAFGILAVCVLSRFYPSSFTPDFMAPSIAVSELDARAGDLDGHKRRVEGRVSSVMIDRDAPADTSIVLRLQLTDLDGETMVLCPYPRDAILPASGSLVSVVGEVDADSHDRGPALVADRLKVLQPPTYVASADGR